MIDGHSHLNEVNDVEGAVKRAKEAGITNIIAVGMDIPSNRETLSLAERFAGYVLPAIGYHPCSITGETIDDNLDFIREHLHSCVALGEIGLDYAAKVKKKLQQEVFGKLIEIALACDRPVIVHSRFSHIRAHAMVRDAGIKRAVFHWYSGPEDVLERIISDGYFVSATPALAYSPQHQAAMRIAPLDHILVETDSPVVYQGKRSEPADLLTTIRELSRIRNIEPEEASRQTAVNTRRLYGMRWCFREKNSV
jgi:TatD DNase family protein